MNGGRKKWVMEGKPMTTEVPSYPKSNYAFAKPNPDFRVTREYVTGLIRKANKALVDVRSTDEYTGKVVAPSGMSETAQRAGHIPGAKNIPWSMAVREDGIRFPSRSTLFDRRTHEIAPFRP